MSYELKIMICDTSLISHFRHATGAPPAALWGEALRVPGVQPGVLRLDGPAEAPGQAPPQRRQQDQAKRATHAPGTDGIGCVTDSVWVHSLWFIRDIV